ncbi:MAG: carboxypeptidase M32 [Cyanobacteriota bacterium]|nr:carboxypeptidase M32 [Cyanobacteriota bacterium]
MQTLNKIDPKFRELTSRLSQIKDLDAASALLDWDQTTYMPPGGASARGRQIATLRQIAHQKMNDPALGQLLEDLRNYERDLPYQSKDASLIRLARRNYEKAMQVPASFMAELSMHQAQCYEAWTKARPDNNFALVQPYLEKTLDLSREFAGFFPSFDRIADPLIDRSDYGMTTSTVQSLFRQLRQQLVPILEAIVAAPPTDDSALHQFFDEALQLQFCRQAIARMGYDFERGRQDCSPHPFTTSFSIDDVRFTTRIYADDLNQGLFSTFHEMGHALYEQGIDPELEGTLLADGVSAGMHEAQARLWENCVARSRGFWEYFYPELQSVFRRQLGDVSLDAFYRGINKVARSPIRTDADEVTYNLHVMIRFELELAMLEGKLAVRDLPEAWNQAYRRDLGILPRNAGEGVMQDVHWYCGTIGGMFQGYTLGNLMSAQFYEAALAAHPEILTELERGQFETLHHWFRENIYRHGMKYTATELIERVTGRPLSIDAFVTYIRAKFGELYQL